MREHHRRTRKRFCRFAEGQPEFLAVLLGSSPAKGLERENIDVDIMVVVSAGEMTRRNRNGELVFYSPEFAEDPQGYVDGKLIEDY